MSNKRRAHPRVPSDIQVTVRSKDGKTTRTETLLNISLGGVFIAMEEPPGFGTELDIEFSISEAHRNVRCRGVVVWSTKQEPNRKAQSGHEGVGVRLMQVSIADMRVLSEYIKSQLTA